MRWKTLIMGAGAVTTGCIVMLANADINGSAHDFGAFGWSQGQICLPCHAPHNTNPSADGAPLWNHELTTATYILYGGEAGDTTDLDRKSILCMSCHDGTVALDSFGGNTGSQEIGSAGLLGTDLSDDHPVGSTAVYPDVPWFNDPDTWENDPHGFKLQDMVVDGQDERVVSCSTCHDPHNGQEQAFMLRRNNSDSALCLTCHVK